MRWKIGVLLTSLAFVGSPAMAAITCELTNFRIEAYDHTGVYLHGTTPAGAVEFVNIFGKTTSGSPDCNSKATERRLVLALSAQAQGKSLSLYFDWLNDCSAANLTYQVPTSIQMFY